MQQQNSMAEINAMAYVDTTLKYFNVSLFIYIWLQQSIRFVLVVCSIRYSKRLGTPIITSQLFY